MGRNSDAAAVTPDDYLESLRVVNTINHMIVFVFLVRFSPLSDFYLSVARENLEISDF